MTARAAVSAAAFLALSAAFSWPLVLDPLGGHVARQFDAWSALWLAWAAGRMDAPLHVALSAWPAGESLGRADSFVLLALGPALGARGTFAFLALLGPPISALAAARLAEEAGARWPWTLLTGSAWGFSGIAATALLEGHVYALLDPWTPIAALGALRLGRGGGARAGLLAAAGWAMALLTSAYSGIVATLVLAVLLAAGRRSLRRGGLAALAAGALPVGLGYVALFAASGPGRRADVAVGEGDPLVVLGAGSARLSTLAGWTGDVDLHLHSIAPVLGWTALALAVAALRLDRRRAAPFLALAALGAALSLGPTLQLHAIAEQPPWLLRPLAWAGGIASFFHFPARLARAAHLGLGVAAALAATRIAEWRPRAAPLLLAAGAVDALLGTGAPLRTAWVPWDAPSAYAAAPEGRAVLELLPRPGAVDADLELALNNVGCAWQVAHGRPLLNRCLGTALERGPRWEVGTWLGAALLEGRPAGKVRERLRALGIGAVAWQPELFAPDDRAVVRAGLEEALGPPAAESRDAGAHVVLHVVPGEPAVEPAERAAAWAALRAELGAT